MVKSNLFVVSVLVLGGLVAGLALSFYQVWAADGDPGQGEINAGDSNPQSAAESDEVCTINTTGAIAHWPLNEANGETTFVDVIGGFNGTCTGVKCPSVTSGVLLGAKSFSSSQANVISVDSNAAFNTMAGGDFSVGVWVKTTQDCAADGTPNKVFIGRYRTEPSWASWWVGCTSPGVAVFRLRDSDENVHQIDGVSKINDGLWHYVVGVRDASSDQNYLYVDGKLEEGTKIIEEYSGDFNSDDPVTIGGYDEPMGYYLQGTLDEIVLFNHALSGNEIADQNTSCSPTNSFYLPIVSR